jgi:hypothetical protein
VSDLYSVFILPYFVASKVVVWKKFLSEYNNNNPEDLSSMTVYRVITYLQRAQLYWFEEQSTSLNGLGLSVCYVLPAV